MHDREDRTILTTKTCRSVLSVEAILGGRIVWEKREGERMYGEGQGSLFTMGE